MFTALHFYRQKRHYLNSPHANFGSRTRWIIRGTMDTLALGSGYLYYQHEIKKDQKVKDACMHITRPAYFWSRLFPIYLHYRWTEFTVKHKTEMEQNEAFEVLHQKYAPVVLNTILHLRGLFIKLGQVGTTRADFVPEAYRKALHKLLDDVPTCSLDEITPILEASLGKRINEVFDHFDPIPLGAASIGQVHAAKLKDGSEVVVKVQYPMVEKLFQSDFETCRAFCKLAQPEQLAAFNELEKQFRLEFDFKREAWALESVHKNITPHFPNVLIPKPVLPLCSRLVLVMSQVPGDKLVDAVLRHYEEFSACIGVKMGELKELSKFQLYRRLAKMYLNGYFTWYLAWAWNHTLGYATKKWDYPKVLEALDGKKLLETIIRIHGHELLINGLFNGDPHPGNILLSYKHHQPVIGLIDYGQVKELTRQQRIHLAQLIVALAQNDQTKVFKIMVALGFRSEKMDTNVFFKQATIALNRDDKEFTEGYNLQQYVEILDKRDKLVTLPDWFIMPMRMSILLRGLGTLLCRDSPMQICVYWNELAQKVIDSAEEGELLSV